MVKTSKSKTSETGTNVKQEVLDELKPFENSLISQLDISENSFAIDTKVKKSLSKTDKKFVITHLYPDQMSIYGDMGNILALRHRLKKYGFKVIYKTVNIGQSLPVDTDIYFVGGGQDQEQFEIFKDLIYKKQRLIADIEDNVPLLAICGGYQLLGEKFTTGEGLVIDGIGVFDVTTVAPDSNIKTRCVGNILTECLIPELAGEQLIGFENHSGQTEFNPTKKCKPLGKVVSGFGNNLDKKFEGAVYKNAIGTYLHGSCLPKNPALADYLILQAIRRRAEKGLLDPQVYIETRKTEIDDSVIHKLREKLIVKIMQEKV